MLEAVGHMPAYEQAVGIVRPGGVISRVGVPQYDHAPVGSGGLFGHNLTLTGGPAPVRAYVERLLTVAPGDTPKGYAAMDERTALKAMVRP